MAQRRDTTSDIEPNEVRVDDIPFRQALARHAFGMIFGISIVVAPIQTIHLLSSRPVAAPLPAVLALVWFIGWRASEARWQRLAIYGGGLLVLAVGLTQIGPVGGLGALVALLLTLAAVLDGRRSVLVASGVYAVLLGLAGWASVSGVTHPEIVFADPLIWLRIGLTTLTVSVSLALSVRYVVDRLVEAVAARRRSLERAERQFEEAVIARAERDEALAQLKARNRSLENLLYVATHDLRTPLVTLTGFVDELHLGLTEVETALDARDWEQASAIVKGELREASSFIDTDAQRMGRLIEGLLEIGRLERVEPAFEVIHSGQVFVDVLGDRAALFAADDLRAWPLAPAVRADPHLLARVFELLIDNAVRYRGERSGRLVFGGRIQQDGAVLLCVRDGGVGIREAERQRVFRPFYRGDPAGETGGMGLSLARIMVERMGGQLIVGVPPAQGTVIMITLPGPGSAGSAGATGS